MALIEDSPEVFRFTRAAGGDYWDMRRLGNGARQIAVESLLHAVGIHGSQEDFPGPQSFTSLCPFYGVDRLIVSAAAGVDLPLSRNAALGINRQNHSLRAEFFTQLTNQCRPPHSGCVHADFVCAREQDPPRVGN